jgi:hypothetical protein
MAPETTQDEPTEGSALRSRLEDVLSENRKIERSLAGDVFAAAGFGPDTPEGRMLADAYDGPVEAEAIREFAAREFGWTEAPGDVVAERELIAQARAEGEQRLAMLDGSSLPFAEPTVDSKLDRAAAEGDWATYDRLQAAKLANVRSQGQYRA